MDQVEELVKLLGCSKKEVSSQAAGILISICGSDEGVSLVYSVPTALKGLVAAYGCDDDDRTALSACGALVNLCTNENALNDLAGNQALWTYLLDRFGAKLTKEIRAGDISELSVCSVKLLNNLTTTAAGAARFVEGRLGKQFRGNEVVNLLCAFIEFPHRIPEAGLALTNATRLEDGQAVVNDVRLPYFRQCVELIKYDNETVRLGVLTMIRNCCFFESRHKEMLVGTRLVENLLLPLLGKEAIPDEDDFKSLPDLLKNKLEKAEIENIPLEREPNVNIRRSIVDSLLLLCRTRFGREFLRDKKTYAVVKEYHANETDEEIYENIFKLVDLLLGDEEDGVFVEEEFEADNLYQNSRHSNTEAVVGDTIQASDAIETDECMSGGIMYELD